MKNILIIVGKSGVGKDTILKEMCSRGAKTLIGYTSRPKRPNEVDGQDYFFVDKEYFERNEDEFLEYVEFNGNYYGTTKEDFENCDVCVTELNGMKQIMEHYKDSKEFCVRSIMILLDETERRERIIKRDGKLDFDRLKLDEAFDIKGLTTFYVENVDSVCVAISMINFLKDDWSVIE